MPPPLGQHFLSNNAILHNIARETRVVPLETVVEIGPGKGSLTKALHRELAEHGGSRLIALERDPLLAAELVAGTADWRPAVDVVTGNAIETLQKVVLDLGKKPYCIAGNIPYYLTGRLLRIFAELPQRPRTIVLTIQKEVAERLAARPPHLNLLAASVQHWAIPEILFSIPRTAFEPPPKIDSSVIRLTPRSSKPDPRDEAYFRLLRILFKQPRKTIGNNLREGGIKIEALHAAGIDPKNRPQSLTEEQIIKLQGEITAFCGGTGKIGKYPA
jgi:16S rRNA (adenine1518-N6/adenine1519-N6)-dimethyltransferase